MYTNRLAHSVLEIPMIESEFLRAIVGNKELKLCFNELISFKGHHTHGITLSPSEKVLYPRNKSEKDVRYASAPGGGLSRSETRF